MKYESAAKTAIPLPSSVLLRCLRCLRCLCVEPRIPAESATAFRPHQTKNWNPGKNGNALRFPALPFVSISKDGHREFPAKSATESRIPAESASATRTARVSPARGPIHRAPRCGPNRRFPAKTATTSPWLSVCSVVTLRIPAESATGFHPRRTKKVKFRQNRQLPSLPRTERATRRGVACSDAEAGRGRGEVPFATVDIPRVSAIMGARASDKPENTGTREHEHHERGGGHAGEGTHLRDCGAGRGAGSRSGHRPRPA